MESSKETGCQAPEGPIQCVNNCGFFGSAATMNMCSKCHKEMILKQEQTRPAASSIENIVNRSSSSCEKDSVFAVVHDDVRLFPLNLKVLPTQAPCNFSFGQTSEGKPKESPSRCTTCRKRVGLTGFNCRCGHLYCAIHRYSDKHECSFDYHSAAQNAIAKENPIVKAEKLDKI